MGKLFSVGLSSWIVIAMFAIQQTIAGSKSGEKAFNELYLNYKKIDTAGVLKRLEIIEKDATYSSQAGQYYVPIAKLKQFAQVGEGRCTLNVMREFKSYYDKTRTDGRAVDQYVERKFTEQITKCKDFAKSQVKRFKDSNPRRWQAFMAVYNHISSGDRISTDPYDIVNAANRQGRMVVIGQDNGEIKRGIGSNVGTELTNLRENCNQFERLNELLQIQKECNENYQSDKELVKYMSYMYVCDHVRPIQDYGSGYANNMMDESIKHGSYYMDKVDTFLDVQNNAGYALNPNEGWLDSAPARPWRFEQNFDIPHGGSAEQFAADNEFGRNGGWGFHH